MQTQHCPQMMALARYASGSLAEEAADAVLKHLDNCTRCQRVVDDMARRDDSLIGALRRGIIPETTNSPSLQGLISAAKNKIEFVSETREFNDTALPATTEEPVEFDSFVDCLRKSHLLAVEDVDVLARNTTSHDSESFARELVAESKLTHFQARALLHGRWKGLVLGNYIVLDKLGQGGMGNVFKARHRRMRRIVCLKVLRAAGRKSPIIMERFRREARTVAALKHPNFVVAHDAGDSEGIPFLVMEFIEGRDFARLVQESGPRPLDDVIETIRQTAEALDYAHGAGVIHRDIKPHNLLPDEDGTVKILDMGLARFDAYMEDGVDATRHAAMTNSGVVMGTVDYMSPEQAENSRNANAASDIYSLGCTLYFLLSGEPIFQGETLMEKLVAHREQPIPRLTDVSSKATPELEAVFKKMVAKKPADRYSKMSEVVADLDACQAGRRPSALTRSRSRRVDRRTLLIVVAFILVFAAGVAVPFVFSHWLSALGGIR